MLHLAGFMQILLEKIPPIPCVESELTSCGDEVNHSSVLNMKEIDIAEVDMTVSPTFTSSTTYEISKAVDIDSKVVLEVMDVFRCGGSLSLAAVWRLLRRSYALVKSLENIVRVPVSEGGKVTVVGDIHGSVSDLIHIIDEVGLPSASNKYVFNGDFVDRGKSGVEVMCILLVLFIADPVNVVLNRGNHEDGAICRVYGFHEECVRKYDELTFGMFAEVFRFLPLFVIVSDSIFIVHGGLFNTRSVLLEHLAKIDRTDYVAKPLCSYPDCLQGLGAAAQWVEYYRQLQRDALWSDPQCEDGLVESTRGAGVLFGPDVTREFMDNNKIR